MEHINAGFGVEHPARDAFRLEAQRPRLVALCARLTGDPSAAEDLAQETLIAAWRHAERLREPERLPHWLAGIARNLALRWLRARSRDAAHTLALPPTHATDDDPPSPPDWNDQLASDVNMEIDLERQELAALLDRALALLPPETRAALLAHYVEQTPLVELAVHLGANTAAVAMRLQRGKLALRRILTTGLGAELASHAPDLYARYGWETTPLWCTICGRHHLLGRYHVAEGELWLRCPECSPDPSLFHIHMQAPDVLGGVRGYQRAHVRELAWVARYYQPHLCNRHIPCPSCGRMLPRGGDRPHYASPSPLGNDQGLRLICATCDLDNWQSLDSLALVTPAGRVFRRRHPRIRTLRHEHVEAQGRPAVVSRFESVTSADRLAIVCDAETFAPLSAEGPQR
ncbi:MAG TPA: RNA polymerase sigma factor [Ktedonobacterales bacterium]|nr:RNA polymerase sigma factor [Ktedonobacterales bacterium]